MLGCVYKNILGPWESRREAGTALWLKRFQKSTPRAMFRNISPTLHKPLYKWSYGLKSDVILSITVVMKVSFHIYARPQQKYNQGRLNSINPGPEWEIKCSRLLFSWSLIIWFPWNLVAKGNFWASNFASVCLWDHGFPWKNICFVLFRTPRTMVWGLLGVKV